MRPLHLIVSVLALVFLDGQLAGYVSPQADQSGSDQTVYVTKTGTKYHAAGCHYLTRSQFPMKLSDAVNAGYSPCSVCNPPNLSRVERSGSTEKAKVGNESEHRVTDKKTPTGETAATGKPIYVGPRGGRYHYSKSGKKVYERRR